MPGYEATAAVLGLGRKKQRASSPLEMISLVERGLPLAALDRLSQLVAPGDAAFKYRIVPRPTLDRRRKQAGGRLTTEESERLARLARVWALAREVWGSDVEAREFLSRPHMMLEGRAPIDVTLGTDLGARLVEDILGRLQYGSAA